MTEFLKPYHLAFTQSFSPIAYFKTQLDASLLNRYLIENGIYLNHLVFKKMSLEEQFLELTKN